MNETLNAFRWCVQVKFMELTFVGLHLDLRAFRCCGIWCIHMCVLYCANTRDNITRKINVNYLSFSVCCNCTTFAQIQCIAAKGQLKYAKTKMCTIRYTNGTLSERETVQSERGERGERIDSDTSPYIYTCRCDSELCILIIRKQVCRRVDPKSILLWFAMQLCRLECHPLEIK